MKIKSIKSQHGRNFTAIYECEHCGNEESGYGYDDNHFHSSVIPKEICKKCGKCADEKYRPLDTKYPDGVQV